MKNILTAASIVALACGVFAAPSADQVPGRAYLLSSAINSAGASKFEKALAEKGFDSSKGMDVYPDELTAFLKKANVDLQKDIKSYTVCITANASQIVDGGVFYVDGSFDAVKVMATLLDLDGVKEIIADSADDDEAQLSRVKAGIGEALQLTIKKNDFFKSDVVMTLAAVAPNTLVFADKTNFDFVAAAYAGKKPAGGLDAKSPLASVLKPTAKFGNLRAEKFGAVLNATTKLIEKTMVALDEEELGLASNPTLAPFFTVTTLTGLMDESADGDKLFAESVFTFENEKQAEAMQELLLGFKTMITIFTAQAGAPPAISSVFKEIRVKMNENTTKLAFSITVDQAAAFQKAILEETGSGAMKPSVIEAEEADADDVDTITEEEARKLLEEALK